MSNSMNIKRWYLLLGTLGLGLVLFASGLVMVTAGMHTRTELRDELVKEKLMVSDPAILLTYPDAQAPEGVEVPKVLIDTAKEAELQATVIQTHVLKSTGGKTYSELPRDDPNRALYLAAVTLRTALHQAHIGFEITNLVMGIGVLFAALGGAILAFGVPAVHWCTKREA